MKCTYTCTLGRCVLTNGHVGAHEVCTAEYVPVGPVTLARYTRENPKLSEQLEVFSKKLVAT